VADLATDLELASGNQGKSRGSGRGPRPVGRALRGGSPLASAGPRGCDSPDRFPAHSDSSPALTEVSRGTLRAFVLRIFPLRGRSGFRDGNAGAGKAGRAHGSGRYGLPSFSGV